VNGNSGAKYLRQLGIEPSRIVIMPYTPEPSSLYDGPTTRDESCSHHLLYVGHLIDLKGIVPFMKALVAWATRRPERPVQFTVVGSGPLRKQLDAMSKPPNLTVELLGQQPFERVRECYGRAGILVFPSLSDEWGMVVNEAMYAGLPVLGSVYSQAVSDLCTDQETGWTFRTDVPTELENALDRAFSCSVDQLNSMRRAARERVAGITPAFAANQLVKAIRAAQRHKHEKVDGRTHNGRGNSRLAAWTGKSPA
jgi:glycosyltransferase involved in cell wall biosynthesis